MGSSPGGEERSVGLMVNLSIGLFLPEILDSLC